MNALTDRSLGSDISGVPHGMEYGPITVHRHSDEAEDGNRAEDDQNRHGKQTGVQVCGEAQAGQNGEWYSQQSHQQISYR